MAIQYFLTHVLENEILPPKEITEHTKELGNQYSPDFVCTPFKYTLGTMLEGIEEGATIFFQMGGGCRYGYYHELQEQILKDLGHSCTIINLISGGNRISYQELKSYPLKIRKRKLLSSFWTTKKMVLYMDKIDDYIRKNRCYEKEKGSFDYLREQMLQEFSKTKGFLELRRTYHKYQKQFFNLPRKEKKKRIRVGLIGELYTLMEPNANEKIESFLNAYGFEVKRYTNVTYLLFQKKRKVKKYLRKKLVKYRMGADALDNIYHAKELCEQGYDGIIHIKSSFCTPEIGAMPILEKIAGKYGVPILFLSMDLNSSNTGFLTRMEAFCDMLEMRSQ